MYYAKVTIYQRHADLIFQNKILFYAYVFAHATVVCVPINLKSSVNQYEIIVRNMKNQFEIISQELNN